MSSGYDNTIRRHYDRVAEEKGLSPSSTMGDEVIRANETQTILKFVESVAREHRVDALTNGGYALRPNGDIGLTVLDVGCGNGYTIRQLIENIPQYRYVGMEYNEKMREQAETQLASFPSVQIIAGDLRDPRSISLELESVDILICQRVLINLMGLDDQKKGLNTILGLVRPGGALLFIEAFTSGLQNLNAARGEFEIEPIPPAPHNLYLPDDFFKHPALHYWRSETFNVPANFLSTHYFVSRVLHEMVLRIMKRDGFVRNSHFVRFLSDALPAGVGEYAPLRINTFQKIIPKDDTQVR